MRGERFHVDLSSDDEDVGQADGRLLPENRMSFGLIGDIQERPLSAVPSPPVAPTNRISVSGFPAHKKRSKASAFKQQRGARQQTPSARTADHSPVSVTSSPRACHAEGPRAASGTQANAKYVSRGEDMDRENIDEENSQRLARMSDDEIARERQELLAGLSPSLIERLLRKANIDATQDEVTGEEAISDRKFEVHGRSSAPREVSFESIEPQAPGSFMEGSRQTDPDATPIRPPFDLQAASMASQQRNTSPLPPQPTIHFPQPTAPPELDPSDPSFLTNLHRKYFPALPADPSKLAWMSPIPTENSPADQDSPYSPLQQGLPPSSIRFDFRGDLLPPRTARMIPVTKGLHHHGEAAEAAGYTIPELARLARSRFPAQRSVAFQTLGRILYKLGRGVFGSEGSELVIGLWRCVEEGKVLETLQMEASMNGGHVSAKAHATEALWLWQKGGGRRWKAA